MRVDEYKAIGLEIDDNIKKQETTNNLIITILGISSLSSVPASNILSGVFTNIHFLIAIMFISTVLLSRIIHYRNTVYYLITYLELQEAHVVDENGKRIEYKWQQHIGKFKSMQIGEKASFTNKLISIITLGVPFFFKNAGYLVLSSLTAYKAIYMLNSLNKSKLETINIPLLRYLVFVPLILNIILTIFIYLDRLIIGKRYKKSWNCVLQIGVSTSKKAQM